MIGKNVFTIRTSIIGEELSAKHGLLEWFLSQEGKSVKGYTNAVFSGFTTTALCAIIKNVIVNHPNFNGLYHVSSSPISKNNLLLLIKERMRLKTEIIPDTKFKCDRSLDSSKFRREMAYCPPSWEAMIDELANELKGRVK